MVGRLVEQQQIGFLRHQPRNLQFALLADTQLVGLFEQIRIGKEAITSDFGFYFFHVARSARRDRPQRRSD